MTSSVEITATACGKAAGRVATFHIIATVLKVTRGPSPPVFFKHFYYHTRKSLAGQGF